MLGVCSKTTYSYVEVVVFLKFLYTCVCVCLWGLFLSFLRPSILRYGSWRQVKEYSVFSSGIVVLGISNCREKGKNIGDLNNPEHTQTYMHKYMDM